MWNDSEQLPFTRKRQERRSETLGKQPPDDAIVLFDGTSGDSFVQETIWFFIKQELGVKNSLETPKSNL